MKIPCLLPPLSALLLLILPLGIPPLLAEEAETPEIAEVLPATGSEYVPPDTPVRITFSKSMDPRSLQIQFLNAKDFPPRPLAMVNSWNEDATGLTCTPTAPYALNAEIQWQILEAQDLRGHSLSGVRDGRFFTGPMPPEIIEVQPANETQNVPLNTPVTFTFNKAMNTALTQIQFIDALSFPPRMLAMTPSWSADARRMTCTPVEPYTANSQILWQVLRAQDQGGQSLSGLRAGTFFTGRLATIEPKLLSADPPNQATNVARNATFTFTFNVAMNQLLTTARFFEMARLTNEFPVSKSWNAEGKVLTCIPSSNLPPGMLVGWRIEGAAADGGIFASAGGGFITAGARSNAPIAALISLGEVFRQTDTNLWEMEGREFTAVASPIPETELQVGTPAGRTNVLSTAGEAARAMEYSLAEDDSALFNDTYPTGAYRLLIGHPDREVGLEVQLRAGALPPVARFEPWKSPAHAVLGQSLTLAWSIPPTDAPVDYLRLRIVAGGRVLFATPAPGESGALTADSTEVSVPASAFVKAGRAEVSLTAFSFAEANTNAEQRVTVHAARHRNTVRELRIVDGNELPPVIVRTNLPALPLDEPLLIPLVSSNGVRPIRYRVVGGELPPGVQLEPAGFFTGTATVPGVFDATIEATDLLGRAVTQVVRLGTVPLPAGSVPPRLENPALTSEGLMLDLVEPTGFATIVEWSSNLVQWAPCFTNAPGSKRTRVRVAANGPAAFVRARAATGPPRLPVNPLTVAPVLNQDATASRNLDETGGTLSFTNANGFVFTLTVPPAALDRPVTIAMQEISQIAGLPLSGGLIAAVDLQPEGLLFHKLARLDITAPSPVELRTLVGFSAENAGTRFGLQPSFLTNRTISLHLQHFSLAGAGSGTSGDTGGQSQRPPDNGQKRTDQEVADEMARCRMDPNCDINSEETKARLREIFVRQADEKIVPDLRAAIGDESGVENAVLAWLTWLRQMALTCYDGDTFNPQGSGVLESRIQLAANLASRALLNGVQKNCQLCMGGEPSRIARVATLAHLAAAMGFDPGNEPFDCIDNCLKFELRIYSTITSTDAEKTVETETSAKVKLTRKNFIAAQWRLELEGEAQWQVDSTREQVGDKCVIFKTPSSGTADVQLGIWLFRTETYGTDTGQFLRYVWEPQVVLLLGPELEKMPKENRIINCRGLVSRKVEDTFGPAFLSFHHDETVPPDPVRGLPPAIVMNDFSVQSGIVLANTQYLRTESLNNGGTVKENTYLTILHKR